MAEFSGESSLCSHGEGCMKLAHRSVLKQTTTMLEAIQSPISKLCLNFILKDKKHSVRPMMKSQYIYRVDIRSNSLLI